MFGFFLKQELFGTFCIRQCFLQVSFGQRKIMTENKTLKMSFCCSFEICKTNKARKKQERHKFCLYIGGVHLQPQIVPVYNAMIFWYNWSFENNVLNTAYIMGLQHTLQLYHDNHNHLMIILFGSLRSCQELNTYLQDATSLT